MLSAPGKQALLPCITSGAGNRHVERRQAGVSAHGRRTVSHGWLAQRRDHHHSRRKRIHRSQATRLAVPRHTVRHQQPTRTRATDEQARCLRKRRSFWHARRWAQHKKWRRICSRGFRTPPLPLSRSTRTRVNKSDRTITNITDIHVSVLEIVPWFERDDYQGWLPLCWHSCYNKHMQV